MTWQPRFADGPEFVPDLPVGARVRNITQPQIGWHECPGRVAWVYDDGTVDVDRWYGRCPERDYPPRVFREHIEDLEIVDTMGTAA
jgi:hypothetical protein